MGTHKSATSSGLFKKRVLSQCEEDPTYWCIQTKINIHEGSFQPNTCLL